MLGAVELPWAFQEQVLELQRSLQRHLEETQRVADSLSELHFFEPLSVEVPWPQVSPKRRSVPVLPSCCDTRPQPLDLLKYQNGREHGLAPKSQPPKLDLGDVSTPTSHPPALDRASPNRCPLGRSLSSSRSNPSDPDRPSFGSGQLGQSGNQVVTWVATAQIPSADSSPARRQVRSFTTPTGASGTELLKPSYSTGNLSDSAVERRQSQTKPQQPHAQWEDPLVPSMRAAGWRGLLLPLPQKRNRDGSKSTTSDEPTRKCIWMDPENLRQEIQETVLDPPPAVETYYHESGFCQQIARSHVFDKCSMFMVVASSIWIMVEVDFSQGESLMEAGPVFQIVANVFCGFFVFEIIDKWFAFDAMVVALMVLETWILSLFMVITGHEAGVEGMRIVVAMRTLRVSRLVKHLPAVVIIINSLMQAMHLISVVFVILAVMVYIGAIVFRVLLKDTEVGEYRFGSVTASMGTLWLDAVMSGSRGVDVIKEVYLVNVVFAALLVIFVLIANVTMMGVLSGLLVKMVMSAADAEIEKEKQLLVKKVTEEAWTAVSKHDANGDGYIDGEEFMSVVNDLELAKRFVRVGVDLEGLGAVSEFIMKQHDNKLDKKGFMAIIMDHRGTVTAKLKDHVQTREFFDSRLREAIEFLQSKA